jgi:UDP-N-acetylglucosamine--N-acetylmuramyl-(pentapeptide) pyrophosphoryl-undecaprenol N-acetylglucosamine transferase
MILLPLRGSGTRGDQVENARLFEKAGAALNLADAPPDGQSDETSDKPLTERLLSLVTSPERIEKLKRSAAQAKFDGLGSAEFIARAIVCKITEGQ